MKRKRKSPAAVKFIACLLLLASLGMLLLPWLKLAVDTRQGRMEVSEVLELAGQSGDSILELARQGLGGAGNATLLEDLRSMVTTLLGGRFSLPILARLSGQAARLCQTIGEPETAQTLSTAGLAVWILLGLLALLGLIAFCCVFADRRGWIVPYLLLSALVTAGLLLLRAEVNSVLAQKGGELLDQWNLSGLANYFGIDLHIVKMGIAAYLCPFLALLALLLMGIKKKRPAAERREDAGSYPARRTAGEQPAKEETPAPAPKGWTCPGCGSVRAEEESFCTACGSRRPQPKICPVCGKKLPPDAAFCSVCGSRL